MSVTWILVANARHARLFAQSGPNKDLELVKESLATNGNGAHRKEPGRASPRREQPGQAGRNFAHRLAQDLCTARSHGSFNRAVLVAPPGFMGLLNAELDTPTAHMVSSRLDKDYTKEAAADLSSHLGQCLCI